ncbi:SDR family oxidoreductase [Streptomyces albidoflavus]
MPEERDEARVTLRLITEAGRTGIAVPCDIRDEETCRELVARTVAELGGLDLLVNNAAYQMSQPEGIEAITTEQFDRAMRTNLYAPYAMRPALPQGQGRRHHAHPRPRPDAGRRRHPGRRGRARQLLRAPTGGGAPCLPHHHTPGRSTPGPAGSAVRQEECP